jgi:hypothetical protein
MDLLDRIHQEKVVPPLHLDILLLAAVMVVFTTRTAHLVILVDLVVVVLLETVEELLDLEEQVQETLVEQMDLFRPIMDGATTVVKLTPVTLVVMVAAVVVPVVMAATMPRVLLEQV